MSEQITGAPSAKHSGRARRRWQAAPHRWRCHATAVPAALLLAVAAPVFSSEAVSAAPGGVSHVPMPAPGSRPAAVARIPGGLQQAIAQALDPTQQAELTAADTNADEFGNSVAIDDGTAVIGAPTANSAAGAAYVFTQSGGAWTLQAELTAADQTAGSGFGWSVAISGSTIAVGARTAPSGQDRPGAVYMFTGSGGTWSQQAELTGSGASWFGWSVALSGGTLAVGAPGSSTADPGEVFVFTGSGGAWTQQADFSGDSNEDSGGHLGWSVATDGDTVFAGEPYAAVGASGAANGEVYVLSGSGGTWTRQAVLTAADTVNDDEFGQSVAVSGGTAVIGAIGKNFHTGAAYVFTGSGPSWTQQTELTASDGAENDQFGASVALSGGNALIGAYGHNPGGTGTWVGTAYLFSGSGSSWSQQAGLTASDASDNSRFGWSVAMSGSTMLVGAYTANNSAGAAYVFGLEQPQAISFTAPGTGTVGGSATLTAAGGGSGNPVVFSVDPSSGTGVCTVSGTNGSTVNYTAAGSCVIDANQAGNAGYSPAPQATGTITVNEAPAFVIDSPPTTATAGQLYDYTFTASGTPAPTYALSPGAPSWLSVNTSTSEVSGTPPVGTTTFSYSVTATNPVGTATAGPFTITVTNSAASADLSAALSCPASLTVGGTGTCTLTVANNGPAAASKVIAALALPAALSQVSCSSGCIRHANVDAWTLTSLASGASAKFSVTVKASRAGPATVVAAAASQTRDPKPLNNIAAAQITIKH